MTLGERLRLLRRRRRLTQFELAEQAGLAQAYLSQLESGRRQASLETLERLAEALEVPLGTLLDGQQATSTAGVSAEPSADEVLASLVQAGLPRESARVLLESVSALVASLLQAATALLRTQAEADPAADQPEEAPGQDLTALDEPLLARLDGDADLPPPHALPMGLYELWADVALRAKYAITGKDLASLLALSRARDRYSDKAGYWRMLQAIRENEK